MNNNSSAKNKTNYSNYFVNKNSSNSNKIQGKLKFNNINNNTNINTSISKIKYTKKNKLSLLYLCGLVIGIVLLLYFVIAVINYFHPIDFIPKSIFFPTREKRR